jgi:hypothetical protein
VTTADDKSEEVTPFVKSLSGIITIPEDFDEKADYKKHILSKYSK